MKFIQILIIFAFNYLTNSFSLNPISTNNKDKSFNRTVNLAVYYETKCPDSRRFIIYQISKAIQSYSSFLNIILVPFGKANYTWIKDTNSWYFQCQHDDEECYGNMIHNCLIYSKPKFEDHFPFINCTMSNILNEFMTVAKECARTLSVDLKSLTDCADSKLGNSLLYGSGVLTHSLIPRVNYVPWIVVDSLHTNNIQQSAEQDLYYFIDAYIKVNNNRVLRK